MHRFSVDGYNQIHYGRHCSKAISCFILNVTCQSGQYYFGSDSLLTTSFMDPTKRMQTQRQGQMSWMENTQPLSVMSNVYVTIKRNIFCHSCFISLLWLTWGIGVVSLRPRPGNRRFFLIMCYRFMPSMSQIRVSDHVLAFGRQEHCFVLKQINNHFRNES